MFLTYILRRKPIQVSPKWNDPPKVQLNSSSNKIVLCGPTLKNGSVQDSEMIVYKMTVCKIQK